MICEKAKCSRGSLYHHFPNKDAIFKAVYDELCQQIVQQIASYPYTESDPIDGLIRGCVVYLKVFTDPKFAQVVIKDGPQVLGIEYCRSKDMETAYKELYDGVLACTKKEQQALVVTDFLSGALDTYALRIAESKERQLDFERYRQAFEDLAVRLLRY